MDARTIATDALDEAIGRTHRQDPVRPGTGGPAGNARLTAWTGLVLLVGFLAELVTLLDVRGWIGWHVTIGALLIPPALVKTATTGWRIVRYYRGDRDYRQAGPPPLVLRVLGPVVVASTLGVLGTGLWAVLVSPEAARGGVSLLGLDLIMLHKAMFVIWAVATGVHTLGRLLPAMRLTVMPGAARVAGRGARVVAIALTVGVAALAAVLTLQAAGPWRTADSGPGFHHDHRPR
jgi:hypothetical protein